MNRKKFVPFLVLLLAAVTFAQTSDTSGAVRQDLSLINGQHQPPMLGIHWARGFEPFGRVPAGSPNMTYHGGVIMPSVVSETIF
jgi:hypothetical protein